MARHTTTRSLAIKEVAHQRRQFDTTFKHHKRGCLGSIAVGLAALGKAIAWPLKVTEVRDGSIPPCTTASNDTCVFAWKSKVCYWTGFAAASYERLYCPDSPEVQSTEFMDKPKSGSHANACFKLGQRGYFDDKPPYISFVPTQVDPGATENHRLCINRNMSRTIYAVPTNAPHWIESVPKPFKNVSYEEVYANYAPKYEPYEPPIESPATAIQPAQAPNNDLGIGIGVPIVALAVGAAAVAATCIGTYLHKRHKTPCQVPNTVTPQTSVETKESNI